MSCWVFTCLSIYSKYIQVHPLQGEGKRGRRREPGRDPLLLILRAGFEQPCMTTRVEESETLHTGTWPGGERSANAWVQNWMLLCWRVRAQLLSCYGVCVIHEPREELHRESSHPGSAFWPFSYLGTPGKQTRWLKAGDEWLGGSSDHPSGKRWVVGTSRYLEPAHGTKLCLGTQVGEI